MPYRVMKGKRGQQQKSRKAKSLIFEQDGGLVDCTIPPRSESGRAPFPQAAPLCRPLLLSSAKSSHRQLRLSFSLLFKLVPASAEKSRGDIVLKIIHRHYHHLCHNHGQRHYYHLDLPHLFQLSQSGSLLCLWNCT